MNKLVVELSNDIYDMSRVDAIDCVSAMERFPTLLDLWIQTVKQQERCVKASTITRSRPVQTRTSLTPPPGLTTPQFRGGRFRGAS